MEIFLNVRNFPFIFHFFSLCFFSFLSFSFLPDLCLLFSLSPMCSPSLFSRARPWPYFNRPILSCPATPRPKIGPVLFTMLPSSTLYSWFAMILAIWGEFTSRKPPKNAKNCPKLLPLPNWPKPLTRLWSPLHHKPMVTSLASIHCWRREKSVVKVPAT